MDNKDIFLTRDILDNLTVRVTNTLPNLKDLNPNTIWDTPIVYCQKIENNIREVATVVLEAQKEKGYYRNSTANPLISQMILTRVYILLYFRHKNEPLYGAVVFPELEKHMGRYGSSDLKDIQDGIGKVLETERLIEQNNKEKKKNVKPKYSIINLDEAEADEYFNDFSNEKLFRELCVYLEGLRDEYFSGYDVASIWLTAKDVTKKLWREKYPHNCIDRIIHKLSENTGAFREPEAAEVVMFCVYVMMRTVKKSDHFKEAIEYLESIKEQSDEYLLLPGEISGMNDLIDVNEMFDDYDYTEGVEQVQETFSKVEVEEMLRNQANQFQKDLHEKDTLIDHLIQQKQINEKNSNALEVLKKENLKQKEDLASQSLEIDKLKEIIRTQKQTIEEQKTCIGDLNRNIAKQENDSQPPKNVEKEFDPENKWIDWLDADVFKPNINAEKVALALRNIQSPHLSDNCRWYVIYRVLKEIHWLSDDVTQKSILKWANAHFKYGWTGSQQFKFSEIHVKIKSQELSTWGQKTMKTNQGVYYKEFADMLMNTFIEKYDGKFIDRSEFIKGNRRINTGK